MNTDTKDTALDRLANENQELEKEIIELRQQIIKLEQNSIADMTVSNFFKCFDRLAKEHPISLLLTAYWMTAIATLTINVLNDFVFWKTVIATLIQNILNDFVFK